MSETQFRVLQCEHCHALTYKRAEHKTIRCPNCQEKLVGEALATFTNAKDAIAYIKAQKMKNAPQDGNWFETFG